MLNFARKKTFFSSMNQMRRYLSFLILCATLWHLPLHGQTDHMTFRRFMSSEGLSDNTVLCGLRDSYGFMWLGTADGLNCYDGQHNTVFRQLMPSTVAFGDNRITSLLEVDGQVWCGTAVGVYVYRRERGEFSRLTASTRYGVMVSSTVTQMALTPDGRVWLCTLGQGVFVYDPRSGELLQDSRSAAFVTDLALGRDGRVCLTSLDGSLLIYGADGHCLAEYEVPDFVSDKNIICVGRVGDRVFVGCDQGLFCLQPGEAQLRLVPASSSMGYIRSLLAEDTDHLLLGTDHGLYRYQLSAATFSRVDDPNDPVEGLSEDCINNLLLDPDGTLWVCTEGGGVCYQPARPRFLQLHQLPIELSGRPRRATCHAFCPMPDGTLFVGTDAGLFRFQPATGDIKPVSLGSETYEVTTLMADGQDLWVGTRHDGILVLSLTSGERRRHVYSSKRPYTVASNEINRIFRTRSGDIYVATSWGICRYDRHGQRFMGFSEINAMTPFVDVAQDSTGGLWAATSGRGLFYMAPGRMSFEGRSTDVSLHSNAISCVMTDCAGTLWVAHKDGVLQRYRTDTGTFEDFSFSTPAPLRQIHFMMEDRQNRLWLGTAGGVLCMDSTRTEVAEVPRLSALMREAQNGAAAIMADGVGCLGSSGQFLTFDPQRAAATEPPPPVYVLSMSFPYVTDSRAELQRLGLDRPLYTTSDVRLPYSLGSFTLHFAAPHFTGQGPVRYEYILQGYDRTWARGTENAEATYAHLPPGDYEFLLREASSSNPGTYARLRITVLPPWYSTVWARLCYALALLAGLALIGWRANRSVRRRYDRRLEAYRLEQEKQSFQSKISFFINLVHEIRTPLTLMSLPLEQLEQQPAEAGNRQHLDAIRRNMNYLLGITNQLLDFQKAEHGSISLQLTRLDVCQLLRDVAAQFTDAMAVRGMQFQQQLPAQPLVADLDRDKISKVLMNLLGNALKYARSEVILRLEETEDEQLRIAVVDDGPGIPDAEKNRIFDLYHQIAGDNVAASLGTGLGLAHAQMLVTAHGGHVSAEDAPGGGTIFVLTLPRHQAGAASVPVETPALLTETDSETADETDTDAAAIPAAAADETTERQPAAPSRRTLLLVEDNEELLSATAAGLKAEYRVLKARDGLQALDLLKHQEVDVIISDVMMPRMDGIELCQTVKRQIDTSHIPVILLTAKTRVQAKVEGMAAGADVYLEKPFAMQQLRLQLRNLLRLRQQFHERLRQLEAPSPMAGDADSAQLWALGEQDLHFMQRLQELVEKNMRDEQFSIDTLAEQMNMSRSSFYRKIKALTDLTPVDYMKNQRLQRAATLLRQGGRITEVAAQVGFTSSSYFAKCFRVRFGVLPKDFLSSNTPVS